MKELFLEIWEERDHICEECGADLGDVAIAHFFSHIHSKQVYPEIKYEKDNIQLLCYDHHYQYDFGGKHDMKVYQDKQELIQELRTRNTK